MATAQKKYELVFISSPEKSDDDVTKISDTVKGFIEKDGGTVDHVEQWGKKKLAYLVKKQKYGHYTMILFTAPATTITAVETNLRHSDNVIKFITLLHDERSMLKPPAMDASTPYYQNRGDR